MHPIHYSMIMNVLILVICAGLSWRFDNPLLVVIALLVLQHTMAKFSDDDMEDEEESDEPRIGFTADID